MENIIHLHFKDSMVLEVSSVSDAKNIITHNNDVSGIVTNNTKYQQELGNFLQEVR